MALSGNMVPTVRAIFDHFDVLCVDWSNPAILNTLKFWLLFTICWTCFVSEKIESHNPPWARWSVHGKTISVTIPQSPSNPLPQSWVVYPWHGFIDCHIGPWHVGVHPHDFVGSSAILLRPSEADTVRILAVRKYRNMMEESEHNDIGPCRASET